jgi:hypothetical protein
VPAECSPCFRFFLNFLRVTGLQDPHSRVNFPARFGSWPRVSARRQDALCARSESLLRRCVRFPGVPVHAPVFSARSRWRRISASFFLLPHFFFVSRCRCFRFGQITVHAPRARRPESRSRVPAQPSFPASRFSGLCSCRCSARIKSLSRSPFLAQSFR